MEQGVWQEIELLYQKFQKLGISESVDYDKYYPLIPQHYNLTLFISS